MKNPYWNTPGEEDCYVGEAKKRLLYTLTDSIGHRMLDAIFERAAGDKDYCLVLADWFRKVSGGTVLLRDELVAFIKDTPAFVSELAHHNQWAVIDSAKLSYSYVPYTLRGMAGEAIVIVLDKAWYRVVAWKGGAMHVFMNMASFPPTEVPFDKVPDEAGVYYVTDVWGAASYNERPCVIGTWKRATPQNLIDMGAKSVLDLSS